MISNRFSSGMREVCLEQGTPSDLILNGQKRNRSCHEKLCIIALSSDLKSNAVHEVRKIASIPAVAKHASQTQRFRPFITDRTVGA